MLAGGHCQPAILIGQDGVGQVHVIAGEIRLELVAEAARDAARGAQPDPPGLVGKAQSRIGDAVGRIDRARVKQDPAARLEPPAILALDLRRAVPADLHRLLLRQLFLGRDNFRIGRRDGAGRGLLALLHRAQLRLQVGDLALELLQLAEQRRCLFGRYRLRHRCRGAKRDRCGSGQQAEGFEHGIVHERARPLFCVLR